jgi:hypothetical protein
LESINFNPNDGAVSNSGDGKVIIVGKDEMIPIDWHWFPYILHATPLKGSVNPETLFIVT